MPWSGAVRRTALRGSLEKPSNAPPCVRDFPFQTIQSAPCAGALAPRRRSLEPSWRSALSLSIHTLLQLLEPVLDQDHADGRRVRIAG